MGTLLKKKVLPENLGSMSNRTGRKNGQDHTVPLVPLAKRILDNVPVMVDADGKPYQHVFTSGRARTRKADTTEPDRDRPISGWTTIKARLDKKIAEAVAEAAGQKLNIKKHAIPHWTPHDLRRTLRTGLPMLGVSPDTAERVLGHVIGGVRGVYDRHAYDKEKRLALTKWAAHVEKITSGKPTSNVIELREAR